MKNLKKVLSFSAAAAFGILLSACASTGVSEKEARYYLVTEDDAMSLVSNGVVANAENKDNVQIKPGVIYLTEEMEEIFKVEKISAETNEYGLLTARVYGENLDLGFFTWLVHGENPYAIGYRFIWFDEDGKIIDNGIRDVYTFGRRTTMPGDPVRYSGIAKTEKTKNFSLALVVLKNPYTMCGCMSDEKSFLPPSTEAKAEEAKVEEAEETAKAEAKAKEEAPKPAVSEEQQHSAAMITGDVAPENKLPVSKAADLGKDADGVVATSDVKKADEAVAAPADAKKADEAVAAPADAEKADEAVAAPADAEKADEAVAVVDEVKAAPEQAAQEVKPAVEEEKKAPAAPQFEEEYNYLKN